jgi:hypothetical protein
MALPLSSETICSGESEVIVEISKRIWFDESVRGISEGGEDRLIPLHQF